ELEVPAPVETADRRVETLPQTGLGRVLRVLEASPQGVAKPLQCRRQSFQTLGKELRGVDQPVNRRPHFCLQAVAVVGEHGARQPLLADEPEKLLKGLVAALFGDATAPIVTRQDAGRSENIGQCLGALIVAFEEIADPAPQPAGTRAPTALRADEPAA